MYFFYSDRVFTIIDRDVGKLSAVKIRLEQTNQKWQQYWNLKQVRNSLAIASINAADKFACPTGLNMNLFTKAFLVSKKQNMNNRLHIYSY